MRFSTSRLLGGSLAVAALAVGTFASVTAAPPRLPANPVRVSVQALGQDRVEVVLTNTSRKTLRIPKWQLPSAAADSNLFRISREGEEVRFHGRMIKRAAPTMTEFAVLRPGQVHRSVVELGRMYDLSKPGLYTVTYATALQYASLSGGTHLRAGNGAPLVAQAAPIRISLDRAIAAGNRVKPVLPANPTLSDVLGISTVSCSANQISQINQAVLSARSYSENAKGYLNSGATGARYTTWFGAYSSSRYDNAKQHFVNIDNAMDQTGGQVTINCGCNENYFAYVYKNQHYQIWVCNAFWSAPLIGTDSKAGTLIHEMSHFTVVADTDDHVYGHTGAKNLAISNPTNAVDNADNHEYFAENTPFQN